MHVTHLEGAFNQTRYETDRLQTTHRGRPFWTRYDLDAVRAEVDPSVFGEQAPTMGRYRKSRQPVRGGPEGRPHVPR